MQHLGPFRAQFLQFDFGDVGFKRLFATVLLAGAIGVWVGHHVVGLLGGFCTALRIFPPDFAIEIFASG